MTNMTPQAMITIICLSLATASPTPGAEATNTAAVETTDSLRFESISVGTRQLRYLCQGQGTPAVITEGGLGLSFEEVMARPTPFGWQLIFLQVRKKTRMCVYDRANLGKSDKAPIPRTVLDEVHDLHAMLQNAHIKPPYVFVGQSSGGLNAHLYASLYPTEVVGMVLVDSSHPDQSPRLKKVLPSESPGEWWELAGLRNGPDPSFSPEGIDYPASDAQVRAAGALGSIPLIVLTHDPNWTGDPGTPAELQPVIDAVEQDLQRDLLRLSTHSRQIIAVGSGHAIQFYEPQLVTDAILEVVAEVRR
jgi:pimeloyl-ACP methyl ester carboxylesterase